MVLGRYVLGSFGAVVWHTFGGLGKAAPSRAWPGVCFVAAGGALCPGCANDTPKVRTPNTIRGAWSIVDLSEILAKAAMSR